MPDSFKGLVTSVAAGVGGHAAYDFLHWLLHTLAALLPH